MLIHWRGKGYIVPIVTFSVLCLMEWGIERYYDDDTYYQTHGLPILYAFLISGIVVGYIAPRILKSERSKEVHLGDKIYGRREHTFFGISLKYWGNILICLGPIFYFLITFQLL
jgi:hypothetical protein